MAERDVTGTPAPTLRSYKPSPPANSGAAGPKGPKRPLSKSEERLSDYDRTLRQLYTAVALFVGLVAVATAGYRLAGWTLLESIYMVIITIFGVGFGEVHPLDQSPGLRIFTMLVIVGGYAATLVIFGTIVKLIAEGEINKVIGELRKARTIDGVSRHTIICGYGRIGQVLAHELASEGHPFVVVDRAGERLDMAEAAGYLCVRGNATDEDTLVEAGIRRALTLATVLPEDTANVYITLTARTLHKDLRIIARGEQPSAEKKLLAAGADEVVLPSTIGAQRIAHSITRPTSTALLADVAASPVRRDLEQMGLSLVEHDIGSLKHLIGKQVGDLQRAGGGTIMVLAIKHGDGSLLESPPPDTVLNSDDHVVAMVHRRNVPEGLLEPMKARTMVYRGLVTEVDAAPPSLRKEPPR